MGVAERVVDRNARSLFAFRNDTLSSCFTSEVLSLLPTPQSEISSVSNNGQTGLKNLATVYDLDTILETISFSTLYVPSPSPQYTDFIQKGRSLLLTAGYWQNLNLVHGSPFLASFVAHYITFREVDFLFCGVFNDL